MWMIYWCTINKLDNLVVHQITSFKDKINILNFLGSLYIQSVSKLSDRYVETVTKDQKGPASCWVRRINACCWLEMSFLAWVYCNMHRYINVNLSICVLCMIAQENGLAVQSYYVEKILGWNLPNTRTFERVHWEFCINCSFKSSRHDTGTLRFRGTSAIKDHVH